MDTRRDRVVKVSDLKEGDVFDIRSIGYGHGYKYHIVMSNPFPRVSNPSQFAFQSKILDLDNSIPHNCEGKYSCCLIADGNKLVRLPKEMPSAQKTCW